MALRLEEALEAVADLLCSSGHAASWSLGMTVDWAVGGPGTVRVGVQLATPEGRLLGVMGVVGRACFRREAEDRLVERMKADGWPFEDSLQETRLRLEVLGAAGVIGILERYRRDLDPRKASGELDPHKMSGSF